MTQKALKLALDALELHGQQYPHMVKGYCLDAITAIKEALAQPEQEPVKIAHRHEWFRTGKMKVGQMRCISCGAWGQEEITQRTWVGLNKEEAFELQVKHKDKPFSLSAAVENLLREKNQ